MAEVKFYKVNTLPGTPVANAWYMVSNGDYAETYVTNSSGVLKMVGNSTMINALITEALDGLDTTQIVANIAARNALEPSLNRNILVYVIDATGDGTVTSGAASYLWDNANNVWIKLTEFESLDAAISWTSISGRPTSTPGQIDAAVAASHSHANIAVLDLLTVSSGVLLYNGDEVKGWNTINW